MKRREFISLFAGVAAAWALEAFGQESATKSETNATKSTLPQIEIVRVRPVDGPPVNLRLCDGPIDLMKDFSLSGTQAIGGAWETLPYIAPADAFDERYGQWE